MESLDGDDDFTVTAWDTPAPSFATSAALPPTPYTGASVVASEPFQEDALATAAPLAASGSGAAGASPTDKRTEQPLVVRIHDPEKHGEGSYDAHVTYGITTQTSLPSYAAPRCTSRRRYQDFAWLRSQLVREFQAVIVPPLPEKHRMEYLDRFSASFIERRQAALQRFLDRIAAHPQMQKSDNLRLFLEAKAWGLETAKQLKKSAVLDDIGDLLLNTFAKIRRPDERFVAMYQYVMKLEENLTAIERLEVRIAKRHTDMIQEMADVGSSFSMLSGTEVLGGEALEGAARVFEKSLTALRVLNDTLQSDIIERIRDHQLYCGSVKRRNPMPRKPRALQEVLYQRDLRQLEVEDLTELLTQAQTNRDKVLYPAPGSAVASDWLNTFSGRTLTEEEKEKQRQQRVDAMNLEIQERAHSGSGRAEDGDGQYQAAVNQSEEVLKQFNQVILYEMENFQAQKNVEMKAILKDFSRSHATFFRQLQQEWEKLAPVLESMKV